MIIKDSLINLVGYSARTKAVNSNEELEAWVGNRNGNSAQSLPVKTKPDFDKIFFGNPVKSGDTAVVSPSDKTEATDDELSSLSEKDKQTVALIEQFLESLTGKKIKLHIIDRAALERSMKEARTGEIKIRNLPLNKANNEQPGQPAGWGLRYEFHEIRTESESMSFEANGVVTTADGREIKLSISAQLRRETISRTDVSLRAGDALLADPLVINFGASAPALSDGKIDFDINNDGTKESISFLKPGSGFLAIDKNGDGAVTNGSELFGPESDNGFADLALYDSDGNNWIDENDPVFDQLRIWTKDESGNDHLTAIGEKGIGAIYLGNVDTEFTLNTDENAAGILRKSGIYLNENGTAGTVTHIDLKI